VVLARVVPGVELQAVLFADLAVAGEIRAAVAVVVQPLAQRVQRLERLTVAVVHLAVEVDVARREARRLARR